MRASSPVSAGHAQSVVSVVYVSYVLCVLARRSLSFVLPAMLSSNSTSVPRPINEAQLGVVVSVQGAMYAMSKFLVGSARTETAGGVGQLAMAMAGCGLCVLGCLCIHTTAGWALQAALHGAAQGLAWPAVTNIIAKWSERDDSRSFGAWWSVMATSNNVAGIGGPLLLPLILSFGDWRLFLQIVGSVCIVWAVVCGWTMASEPPVRKTATAGSETLQKGLFPSVADWRLLLEHRFLRMLCIYYALVMAFKTFAETWVQLFLVQVEGISESRTALFLSVIEVGGFFGSFCVGIASERLAHILGVSKLRGRSLLGEMCLVGAAIALHLVYSATTWLLLWGAFLGFCLYASINAFGIIATEIAPSHLSGSSHALASLASSVGAVLAGLPFGWVVSFFGYSYLFFLLQALTVICLTMMLMTNGSVLEIRAKE